MEKNQNLFLDEEKQLSDLQMRIENELNMETHLKLKNFASRLTNSYVISITAPFHNISDKRLSLLEQMDQNEDPQTTNKLVQQYYKNFNPAPIYTNFSRTLNISSLVNEYNRFVKGLYQVTVMSNAIKTHVVDASALKIFQTGIHQICTPLLKDLERHTINLKNYGAFMKKVAEQNKNEKNEWRTFRIVTAVVAGPIPALIARGISSNLSGLDSDQERIVSLAEKVESDWIKVIEKKLPNFEAELRRRYLLIVYTLFGGMLLKLQEEIKKHGYEIKDFDWTTMQANISLSTANTETISIWITSSLNKIDSAIKSGKPEEAKLLTEYLSTFLKDKKILNDYEYFFQDIQKTLPLINAIKNRRLNAHMLDIDKSLWASGKYNDAINKYMDILTTYEDFEVHHELIREVPEPAIVLARIIAITEANSDNIYAEHLHNYFYDDAQANKLFRLYRNYRYSETLDTTDDTHIEEIKSKYSEVLQETGLLKDSFQSYLNNEEGYGPLVDEDVSEDGLLDNLYNSKFFGGMTLSDAIRKNDIPRIKHLISKSRGLGSINAKLQSPLIVSIEVGNHLAFELLMEKKVDINFKDMQKNTALHHAVKISNLKMLEMLINHEEIELNPQNAKGMTPLMLAVCQNDIQIVKALINAGAEPSIKDEEDVTPLFASLIRGYLDISNLLFPYTDIEERSNCHGGVTILMFAAKANNAEMISLLLEKGADSNAVDHRGKSVLTHAIEGGMGVNTLETLGESHVDFNFLHPISGNTPLIEAVRTKNTKAVELLVDYFKVNLNILNYDGDTALSLAQESHQTDLSEFLIEKGAIAL